MIRMESSSERKTDRNVKRSNWIKASRIKVVSVFRAHGADDRVPANASASRPQDLFERIVCQIGRVPDTVNETDDRPTFSEVLFQFEVPLKKNLCTELLSLVVVGRRSTSFESTNGIVATIKESFVERKVDGGLR